MSTTATSGSEAGDRRKQLRRRADLGDDIEPLLAQDPREPFAKDYRVVGQRYAHGSSARTSCPFPAPL